ncbi:DUF4157 domain-containing protein [Mucilaginibacter endophyticus]|uniref:eCIS core domain-containing protein n=1 Tax=Mucilaginibacter endophyticus TaxID=2675003 RepID=UPI00137A81AF|nr:DUF4157 domain-containing protein [Mucilaginibacter endophyticus]
MKTQQKAAPANTKQNQPANRQAVGKDTFFSAAHDTILESPFFEGNKVQRKMTVNEPGDHFERQADQVADKVVQHINQPKTVANVAPATATAPATTSAVQKKEDKKEDKQEKEQNGADKELQRRPIFESDGDPNEGNTLKRSSQSPVPDVSPQTQQKIESSKGGGEPLPANTREEMEGATGADLSRVRIHNNSEAAGLSNDLQAQAFTHGNDIYFGAGKYDPQSQSGQHLLAHEVTHTVQQGGNGVKKKIQRQATKGDISGNIGQVATAENPIDTTASKESLFVPQIKIPTLKLGLMPGSTTNYSFKKTERSGKHIADWNDAATKGAGFDNIFNAKKAAEIPGEVNEPTFFMTLESEKKLTNLKHLFTGPVTQLKASFARPFWDENGHDINNGYDVDHKVELQLGGKDGISNLWMLEAGSNRSSGSNIHGEITTRVDAALNAITTMPDGQIKPSATEVIDKYTITVGKLDGGLSMSGDGKKWELSQIEAGDHLKKLAFLSKNDKARKKLVDNTNLSLITSERYGVTKYIKWAPDAGKTTEKDVNVQVGQIKRNGANLKIQKISYEDKDDNTINSAGSKGSATIEVFMNNAFVSGISTTQPIEPVPGIYGGRLNGVAVKQALSADLKAKGLSPIVITELDIGENGLIGFGKINTDVPFIGGSAIDIIFNEDGIKISKVFNSGEIKVPPPFKITNTSLEVYAATSGIGVKGEANFEIKKLGKGKVGAMANTSGEFALEGSFDFDSKTFNPAQIKAAYRNGEFSASGDIGIPAGKIKGLKSAHIKIDYAKGIFNASGTAEPDIKGVKSAEIHVTYGNETLVIGGSFVLDENMPGIQSGSGNVEVTRGPDEIYHVKANGKAIPKIPKINTELSISYDDGALTIEGKASYAADRVSGEVTVGATNRAIAADGTPSGPAGDKFTAYGSGKLTLKVTDWLQASASVRVTPAGEIEVVGRLDLPSAVDVFPKKSINKELFKVPTIQIPIFAIPLGPKSIGIVATIDGGLDFDAAVGPGQLKDVFGQIEFNPSHPESTRISGGAKFVIPAHAGLKLKAALGIGLSIGPASVTGGIQIVGGLGLEGEASAAADLAWSPTTGFEFNALGEIEVHPKFTFDVNAFIKAELDLWVTDISKEWTKNLASFSYGPDLQVKVSLPIHYKDGEPFDVKTDDIKVTYPEISISDIAGGIADKVKEEML